MKKALVVGGSNGLGLSFVNQLLKNNYEMIYVVDKEIKQFKDDRVESIGLNLLSGNYDIFDRINNIDTLIITAGFGRIAPFESLTDVEISNLLNVNTISTIRIIRKFYERIKNKNDFNCCVLCSIAGLVSSPLFSVYSASKSALCKFIEAINIELEASDTKNRILNVSPGSLKGTKFSGGENDVSQTADICEQIINAMNSKKTLYIPQYNEIYKGVIERYNADARRFGLESYDYKISNGRINLKPQVKIGYLSGTFDLFHIGHLNILERAKQYCDFLVVGVHKDASHKGKKTFIPFEERAEIVRNIKGVDLVIPSKPEDTDVYNEIKYDYLFVGSDYKGSERFNKYEEFFQNTNTQIIYFPYTSGTSSTELRNLIENNISRSENK